MADCLSVLREVIANNPEGIIIHCPDITEILDALNEPPGFSFGAKNIPDDYVSKQGYDWQRKNKRKYVIWKQKN